MGGSHEDWVITEFRAREQRQNVATGVTLASLAGLASGFFTEGLALMAVIATVGSILFGFSNWSCPSCSKHLGKNGVRDGCCYSCGVRLKDDSSWMERHWHLGPALLLLAGVIVALLIRSR